jgi:hypothetical protein
MNADAFRHFYDYHFAENHKLWDRYVTLAFLESETIQIMRVYCKERKP